MKFCTNTLSKNFTLAFLHTKSYTLATFYVFFFILLGEQSETLTNEFQLRFWYIDIYVAKFKKINACPPPRDYLKNITLAQA